MRCVVVLVFFVLATLECRYAFFVQVLVIQVFFEGRGALHCPSFLVCLAVEFLGLLGFERWEGYVRMRIERIPFAFDGVGRGFPISVPRRTVWFIFACLSFVVLRP